MLSLFELTFYFAYFFLAGSTPLTAFEIFNTFPAEYLPLKYILIIETTVNIIAGVAYNSIVNFIKPVNYSSITSYRYLDWFATTPLLLLSFTLYLQYLSRKSPVLDNTGNKDNTVKFDYDKLAVILVLNAIMLIFG